MQIIGENKEIKEIKFSIPTRKTKARYEIGDIIDQFVNEINLERINTKYKPISHMAIKMKLIAIIKDKQALLEFFSICKDYKNRNGSFSRRFFGGLK